MLFCTCFGMPRLGWASPTKIGVVRMLVYEWSTHRCILDVYWLLSECNPAEP